VTERPDREGLKVARAWSAWFLGTPAWGQEIVHAYLNPTAYRKILEADADQTVEELMVSERRERRPS
jgi:hypothetical protein